MAVIIGSARIDERGKASGGQAGDQTGKEISTQNWYAHSKGWRTFRCKNPYQADMIAACMEWACKNPLIGYDQSQNTTLFKELEKVGFDLSKLNVKCETDCARLVRVCVRYAGINVKDFYTASEASALLATGCFTELTGAKYNKQSDYLRRGDIQVTKTKGHTVVVLTDGPKAEGWHDRRDEITYPLGGRILKNGMEGPDVKELQLKLIELGYSCGSYGADGEYGDMTEIAVRRFQNDHLLLVDGEFGPESYKALLAEPEADDESDADTVHIVGGNCWVRESPNTKARAIGVANEGDDYDWLKEESPDGWLKIKYDERGGLEGWVSGKYGKLV